MNKKITEEKIVDDFRKIAEFELPAAVVRQDLAQLRRRLSEGLLSESPAVRNVWRRIMQNKCTKYVSAAMIFAMVFVGMQFLPGGELNAAELLTEVSKNMLRCKVIKSLTEDYRPGQEEPISHVTTITDFENKQAFRIHCEGYLHQMDYEKMIWSIYRPEDNTMIVKPLVGEWSGPDVQVKEYIKKLSQEGLEVHQSEKIENGLSFTVIEYDEVLNNISSEPDEYMSKMMMGRTTVKTIKTRLFIHREDLFLSRAEMSYYDAQNHLIITKKSSSEPVDKAPADIYELGVPADVKIINKVPDERVQEVRKKIETHQNNFLKNYIAVQTEVSLNGDEPRLMEAMVMYSKGEKLRVDVFRRIYSSDKDNPLSKQLEEFAKQSMDRLKPYVSQDVRPRGIRIYDGLWQHLYEEQDGQMHLRKPHRRPDGDMYGDDDVDDFGWRLLWLLNDPEWMYEDDFSKENDLIGMEITRQSQFGRLPERKTLYVDPAKDYLFRRYTEEKKADARWQIDEKWIEEVKDKWQLVERVSHYDVTEYAQTSKGQWYPKIIEQEGYTRFPFRENRDKKYKHKRIRRIYLLEENPDLPDELFEPAILSTLDSSTH